MSNQSRPLTFTPTATGALSSLRQRLGVLRWVAPLVLVAIVVVYEMFFAPRIHAALGPELDSLAEIIPYGTIGPLLVFITLELLGRWLEERETCELQATILAQTRERVKTGRQLSDDALQTVFAASSLFNAVQAHLTELPPETARQLDEAGRALDQASHRLHDHLMSGGK
jgi:signal transduction histidine kinase